MNALLAFALIVSTSLPEPMSFHTQHDAMVAAAHATYEVSERYESGGALYQDAYGYHYTQPVTANLEGEVDYKVRLPASASLVALFHTHPGSLHAREFSESDRQLQKRMRVPMYIVAMDDKEVLAIGAEGFPLFQPAVDYDAIDYNGHECRVMREVHSQWVVDCGRLYFAPKRRYSPHHVHYDAT